MLTQEDLAIPTLGERRIPSPLGLSTVADDLIADYLPDTARVALEVEYFHGDAPKPALLLERAGPRGEIFFDPAKTCAGIVSCGGLCPGINNVIRSMVLELFHKYGVKRIFGFRYGYAGLDSASPHKPVPLSPADVIHVHRGGGSFLGLSRGKRDPKAMVDQLERLGVDILFTIGGDGTLRGAHAIYEEIARRGLSIGVVGIPKTIDNDRPLRRRDVRP
jgi:6-phosphofructokinase 1